MTIKEKKQIIKDTLSIKDDCCCDYCCALKCKQFFLFNGVYPFYMIQSWSNNSGGRATIWKCYSDKADKKITSFRASSESNAIILAVYFMVDNNFIHNKG